jgi:hypothetical protein
VSQLREARRHGDRLIGGVLSDAAAAAPTPRMGIASSCMTAPPRLKIAYDKDTKRFFQNRRVWVSREHD